MAEKKYMWLTLFTLLRIHSKSQNFETKAWLLLLFLGILISAPRNPCVSFCLRIGNLKMLYFSFFKTNNIDCKINFVNKTKSCEAYSVGWFLVYVYNYYVLGVCLLVLVRLVAARRRRNICTNPKWVILELKVFHWRGNWGSFLWPKMHYFLLVQKLVFDILFLANTLMSQE